MGTRSDSQMHSPMPQPYSVRLILLCMPPYVLGMPWQFMGTPFIAFIDSECDDERAHQERDRHPTFGFERQSREREFYEWAGWWKNSFSPTQTIFYKHSWKGMECNVIDLSCFENIREIGWIWSFLCIEKYFEKWTFLSSHPRVKAPKAFILF